jgi:hypothetical protein
MVEFVNNELERMWKEAGGGLILGTIHVHDRVHKSTLAPIMNQIAQLHIFPSDLF